MPAGCLKRRWARVGGGRAREKEAPVCCTHSLSPALLHSPSPTCVHGGDVQLDSIYICVCVCVRVYVYVLHTHAHTHTHEHTHTNSNTHEMQLDSMSRQWANERTKLTSEAQARQDTLVYALEMADAQVRTLLHTHTNTNTHTHTHTHTHTNACIYVHVCIPFRRRKRGRRHTT